MTKDFVPNANKLAALLHQNVQHMTVTKVTQVSCNMKTYSMKASDGHELAYFEAGSYIPVYLTIAGNKIERPYSLSSSPRQAEDGIYEITIKELDNGYVSHYISENWTVGTEVLLGAPFPGECYNPVRDSRNMIVLAGGSGITGFYSLAKAVNDGDVDVDSMTVFYGVNTAPELMEQSLWADICNASNGKIRLIRVVANEKTDGCEYGFINFELIKKYCDTTDASYFISGPDPMIRSAKDFLSKNGVPRRRIRISMSGDSGFHSKADTQKSYTIKVHIGGETVDICANKGETILSALDRAGLNAAARCRSGKCGFCRSMVVSGDFEVAAKETGVRKMDRQLGFIHPCCSLPLSDMEIIIQRGVG